MRISRVGIWTKRGFTLVEVLAALSIAAIGMLGLIQLQLTSMAAADKADQTTQATLLAQSLIAETIARGIVSEQQESGYDTTGSLQWFVTVSQDHELTRQLQAKLPVYRIEAKVTPHNSQRTIECSRLYYPTPSGS